MKKIAVVAIHPLYDNRVAKHIETLVKNGYAVEYINVSDSDGFPIDGVKITQLRLPFTTHNPLHFLKTWNFIRKSLKKSKPDIVHCHDLYLLPAIAAYKGSKNVFDRHERYEIINSLLAKLFTKYEAMCIKKLHGAVYTVEAEDEHLKKIGYKNMACVPNYQKANSFAEIEATEVPEGFKKLLYIGSLSNYDRNMDLLFDLFERAMSLRKDLLCVVGGKTADPAINEKIAHLEKAYPEQFSYLGYCSHNLVVAETKSADISILPFRDMPNTRNSSPNKVYECLLGGTIFVGVGEFALGKELVDTNSGKVFPFDTDCDTLLESVCALLDNEDELSIMKANALEVGAKYTWESIEQRYIEIYNSILE